MSWATAIVIIVAIWALVQVMTRGCGRWASSEEEGGDAPRSLPREEAELKAEIERLRERLEVLERIATDAESREARERKRLEAEIDGLRTRE